LDDGKIFTGNHGEFTIKIRGFAVKILPSSNSMIYLRYTTKSCIFQGKRFGRVPVATPLLFSLRFLGGLWSLRGLWCRGKQESNNSKT
jgi:hypothetical protein